MLGLYLCEQFISFKIDFSLSIFQLNHATFLLALLVEGVAENRRQDNKITVSYCQPMSVKPHWSCVQAHKMFAFLLSDMCPRWRIAVCGSICDYSIYSRDRDLHCRTTDSTSPHVSSEWSVQFSVAENRSYFPFDYTRK